MAMGRPPERGHGVRRVFSQAHAKIGRHEIYWQMKEHVHELYEILHAISL
jgi:hypothetical protein